MFEFGPLVLNCALLLGYGANLNTEEGFLLAFHDCDLLSLCRWLAAVADVSGHC